MIEHTVYCESCGAKIASWKEGEEQPTFRMFTVTIHERSEPMYPRVCICPNCAKQVAETLGLERFADKYGLNNVNGNH